LSFESYEKKWNGEYDTITAKFNYDLRGNPTSIIFNRTTTGRPNYQFKYDQKGRLISLAGLIPGTKFFEFYCLYQNDGNTVVSDSFFFSGSDTSDLFKWTQNLFIGKYNFDDKGRMIEYDYDVYFPMSPNAAPVHDNVKYAYDQKGNRIIQGYTYDDKVNFFRTHPVLQLMNRDYSINNPLPAVSYNRFGLPLTFDHTLPLPYNRAYFMNTAVSKIVYSCN